MQTMYEGIVNSPTTLLDGDIDATQTTIPVIDATKLPDAPNQATIGVTENAETILYAGKSANNLTGCTRGFEGIASIWNSGSVIGRNFTNYDYSSLVSNINENNNYTVLELGTKINTNAALRKWRFALSRLLSGEEAIYNLNFIGDSITEGKIAGNSLDTVISNSFVGIIRNVLRNRYGDVGLGVSPVYQLDSLYPAWSFTGDWTTDTLNLGFAKTHKYTFTQNDTATFSFNGIGLRILAVTGAAGATFSTAVDGGTPIDFNTYSATTIGCAEFAIDGLSDGDHTVVITNTDSNTAHKVRLIGAYPIKGNRGIRVNMMGKVAAIMGNYVGSALADVAVFNIMPPTLTIISLIANDYSQNIDPAT